MPIKKVEPQPRETENHKIMQGMMAYVSGKPHKQVAQRAFLAGIKFYKQELLKTQ